MLSNSLFTLLRLSSRKKINLLDNFNFNLKTKRNFKSINLFRKFTFNIDLEETIKTGKLVPKIELNSIGVSSLLGERSFNEDRVIAVQLCPHLLMFGIFDGHGGPQAVDFVATKIKPAIDEHLASSQDLPQILKKVFLHLNDSFIKQEITKLNIHNPQFSGTTATVCLIRNGYDLCVAHVGDTRATLCRSNRAIRLTQDHKPDLRREMDRIIKCNGSFSWSSFGKSRVNGRLEMTRSIGDQDLKPFGVTAEPDVVVMKIRHSTDSFLLLTTDGTHSKLNSVEIVQTVLNAESTDEAAHHLSDLALFYGSKDNCTSMVIPLGAWGKHHFDNRIGYFQGSSIFPRF
ncbi:hypothetical protein HELRODRAFT_73137 [Helobdella robusta]|uniref:protein-serine/threonine phosphatase n=1 Tax=Helobdella robusta TaxID=6412 RepID=T1G1A7_HELRO|nr:hypothetical protein HELRODRAFT_73137 [Helobdella robusta]ESO09908.1 hypothetical protein HELRODRAFT_73137 [Helobdella robusta]